MFKPKKSIQFLIILLIITPLIIISCSNTEKVNDDETIEETNEDGEGEEGENLPQDEQEEDEEGEDPKNCLATYGENYIVFEAEHTNSPLDQWNLIKEGDDDYLDKENLGPINGTHIEFTGNNIASGPATSPLEYIFTAPTTGIYRVYMRMYQRLGEDGEDDKSNDVYIRLAGDFTSATEDYTDNDLKTDLKFFGRGVNAWGSIYNGDGGENHNKSAILYNLKEGESYTFTMSGRSKNANIDYILFYDTSINITGGAHKDIAELNDAKYRPNWDCSQGDE